MNKKTPNTTNTETHRNHSHGSDFFITKKAHLDLADGMTFDGVVPEWFKGTVLKTVVSAMVPRVGEAIEVKKCLHFFANERRSERSERYLALSAKI